MIDSTSLDGKLAVVTGGAAGIGGGITRLFADAGATVVLNDIDPELAEAARVDIAAAGGRVEVVEGDIRDAATVDRLRDAAVDIGRGRVDILVNNVGDYRPQALFERSDEDQWDAQYAITLQHVFRCTHAFLPAMKEAGGGAIVNVSTVEAYRACPFNSVYTAFNAGVIAFTRTLAVEVSPHHIRVNAIAPRHGRHPPDPRRRDAAGPRSRAHPQLDPARALRGCPTTTPRWCSSSPATRAAT